MKIYTIVTFERYSRTYLAQSQEFNILEQFLDVHLYQFRFLRVGQDLEQILVRNEVKSREHVSFRLQILFQGSLHQLEFATDFIQNLEQAGWSENEEEKRKKERRKEGKLGGAEGKNANASGFTLFFAFPSLFFFQHRTSLPLLLFELQRILTSFSRFEIFIFSFPLSKISFLKRKRISLLYKQGKTFFFSFLFEKLRIINL